MNSTHALMSVILYAARSERRKLMGNQFHSGMHEASLATDHFLRLPEQAQTVLCLEGELWLTRDGECDDHIVRAGERFAVGHREQVTVQALRPSRVRLSEG